MKYAEVHILDVPYAADKPYDYEIPPHLEDKVTEGMTAVVPYGSGNRRMRALITSIKNETDAKRLKCIGTVSDEALCDVEALRLCDFLKKHTFCTIGEAFRAVVPASAVNKLSEYYSVTDEPTVSAMSDIQREIYEYVSVRGTVSAKILVSQFPDGAADVTLLCRTGRLKKQYVEGARQNETVTTVRLAVSPEEAEKIASGDADASVRLRGTKQIALLKAIIDACGDSESGECDADAAINSSDTDKSQLSSLAKHNIITLRTEPKYRDPFADIKPTPPDENILSDEQTAAFESLHALYETHEPRAALLYGVTGSGKTRVIKSMIDAVRADGRGVIMLVPEISLTPQLVGIFRGYYGERVAVLHSSLSAGERFDAWRRIREGICDVVIGTRSAVFAPVKNLGMIVIDEEQEHTYKSDSDPKYSAHEVAAFRCGECRGLMLLSSATPSVTSYFKAEKGIYTLVILKNRYGDGELPKVVITDMRAEAVRGNVLPVSSTLAEKLIETSTSGRQAIVFLNRRGYNSTVTCRICGEAVVCPNCSVSLTYHTSKNPARASGDPEEYLRNRRDSGVLYCHYCGYRMPVPTECPSCHSLHFRFIGCGTQQAEQVISELLPGREVIRMDADTTSGKLSHQKLLSKFRNGNAAVLLGTQMVTKGHDFPNVSLVGVLNADSSLYLDDYRAGERTFAMLTQVIGRAGRADADGCAVVQTMNPDSEVIRLAAAQDYTGFYEREIKMRHALTFPPYCDMVVISLSSSDEAVLASSSARLASYVKSTLAEEYCDMPAVVFGPFEAPLYKVNKSFRMRMIVKCRMSARMRSFIDGMLLSVGRDKSYGNVSFSVDVNPASV